MAYPSSGQWGYPLEETNGNARRLAKRSDIYGSQERVQSASKQVRRTPSDVYNIMSDSEEVKQRRVSLKASNSSTSRKRSRNTLRGRAQADMAVPNVPLDDSAWIHRDKLAQIEIQELEEAGIYVRPSRRSMSADPSASRRSSRSVSRSRVPMSESPPDEPLPNGGYIADYNSFEDARDKPSQSTPALQYGDHDFNPQLDTEFRTPEEVAAEQGTSRSQPARPGTSRIPISKASPVPVPSDVIERDSPLPRSRHGSGGGSGSWDDMQYARRARSSSIGSQAILDQDVLGTPPASGSSNKFSSTENSPSKARVPSNTAPRSGARKVSGAGGADRPGSSYGKDRKTSIPTARPASRSGLGQTMSRPSTSHRHAPEGDPPWMDSMYKPDPRLPPDQQMLPTHARRMMQEQWEKEGKSGTTYDRDLNLLTDKELPSPKLQQNSTNLTPREKSRTPPNDSPRKPSPRLPSSDGQLPTNVVVAWPLTPKSEYDAPQPPASPRPSTTGGLKLTPKISNPPSIQKSCPPPADMQPQKSSLRMPEMDEKDEAQGKKGGCACCVVM